MDKFELTAEQKAQGQAAIAAGETRTFITCTPEQSDYFKRIKIIEDEAFERMQLKDRVAKLEKTVSILAEELAELKGAG